MCFMAAENVLSVYKQEETHCLQEAHMYLYFIHNTHSHVHAVLLICCGIMMLNAAANGIINMSSAISVPKEAVIFSALFTV